MRIGLVSPVVPRVPEAHAPWESLAGIDDLAAIAETADGLGFHHLTCSEHVAVPTDVAETRGGTYWDPLATVSCLAARTRHIRPATQVLVLGDGWVPFGISFGGSPRWSRPRTCPDGFDIVLGTEHPLDPGASPERARRALARAHEAGATVVGVRIDAGSAGHYRAQLAALQEPATQID